MRAWLRACVLGTFLIIAAGAQAQAWPTKPVRIVVPFGGGGATDTFFRILARELQPPLGQAVIIDNRPGGNFVIAAEAVIKAEPDGYTLMAATSGHAVTEAIGTNQSRYRLLRDLTPVATLNYIELLLVAHPSLPVKSIRELVELARAKPGALNYASTGTGGINHLSMELLQSATGTLMTHVPYKVGTAARLDVIGGRVELMMDTLTDGAPNVLAGKLRALGTTGGKRSIALPDVPTLAEGSGIAGLEVPVLIGVLAPTGTPEAVVDRLNREIGTIVRRPEIREAWGKMGATALATTPAEFGRMLEAEIAKWAALIRDAKLTLTP
jgi:tripartite-type tricarboxylate transporter receptor subunit TctC